MAGGVNGTKTWAEEIRDRYERGNFEVAKTVFPTCMVYVLVGIADVQARSGCKMPCLSYACNTVLLSGDYRIAKSLYRLWVTLSTSSPSVYP